MGTTADKINYLNDTKAAIKEAIENKGVTVSDSDTFRSYAEKIEDISGGDHVFTTSEPPSFKITTISSSCVKMIEEIDFTIVNIELTSIDQLGISEFFKGFTGVKVIKFPLNITEITSKSSKARNMFESCQSLVSLDLSLFDTSNIKDTYGMFISCSSLTSLNISSFDTSNITNMTSMFRYCRKLTNVIWGNNWANNSTITSFSVSDSPLSHESCLDLFNKLATRDNNPTLTLSTTTKGYMSEEEIAIATNKGWTVA